MRKILLICVLSILVLSVPASSLASSAQAAAEPPKDWAWLAAQVAGGAKTVTLPNSIIRQEGDEGLIAPSPVTIEGNNFTLGGALVSGGTVIFQNVQLSGQQGLDQEDGGAALTLMGQGTVAVLSGSTQAKGGNSGMEGERGGDGVLLTEPRQGVILRNAAKTSGGIGKLYGGCGVRVAACNASVLLTDNAACIGDAGVAEGGAGIDAPGCVEISFHGHSSALGGRSVYDAGAGVRSLACTVCGKRKTVAIDEGVMISGGVGGVGGSAVWIERQEPSEGGDLLLAGGSYLFGGNGGTGGSAIRASGAAILYMGEVQCYSGGYYQVEAKVLALEGCKEIGKPEEVRQFVAQQVKTYPASDISLIINSALSLLSDRHVPMVIEDGVTTLELKSKWNGVTVERGPLSQAKVNDGNLKISLFDGTLEKRLSFEQRLGSDGGEGTRLVLVATKSQYALTVDSTVAALKKLDALGVTQFVYTTAAPVYLERIIDIKALLSAIEADEKPVDRVLLGTRDDCVIFIREDGAKDYQEELMKEILRPLPRPAP